MSRQPFNFGHLADVQAELARPSAHEIVRRVEALFALADEVSAQYNAARARARVDRLTPAQLAKAFRGELVAQGPNGEPASVLLERIRAERAAAPKPTHCGCKSAVFGASTRGGAP